MINIFSSGDSNSSMHCLFKEEVPNPNPLSMKNIQKKDLENLFEHISSIYVGDYATVSRDLNRAVYYLHYLEKEMIPTHEV